VLVLQLDRLEKTPVIKDIIAIPVVRSILLGVLPGLALRLFVLLLPILLYALNNHAGYFAISDVDFAVSTQYFVVQVSALFAWWHDAWPLGGVKREKFCAFACCKKWDRL
jgi:hypothetical protein